MWTKQTMHTVRHYLVLLPSDEVLEVAVTASTLVANCGGCTKLLSSPHSSLPFAFRTQYTSIIIEWKNGRHKVVC